MKKFGKAHVAIEQIHRHSRIQLKVNMAHVQDVLRVDTTIHISQ